MKKLLLILAAALTLAGTALGMKPAVTNETLSTAMMNAGNILNNQNPLEALEKSDASDLTKIFTQFGLLHRNSLQEENNRLHARIFELEQLIANKNSELVLQERRIQILTTTLEQITRANKN